MTPKGKAKQDYQDGEFYNPYPENSIEWMEYEQEKDRLEMRELRRDLYEFS